MNQAYSDPSVKWWIAVSLACLAYMSFSFGSGPTMKSFAEEAFDNVACAWATPSTIERMTERTVRLAIHLPDMLYKQTHITIEAPWTSEPA